MTRAPRCATAAAVAQPARAAGALRQLIERSRAPAGAPVAIRRRGSRRSIIEEGR